MYACLSWHVGALIYGWHRVIDIVLNADIFWIELSFGGESVSKKMTKILILDWSHRSKNHLRSSSGSGWPIGNIHFEIIMNLFQFTYNVVFPLSSTTLHRTLTYIGLLAFACTWVHPLVLVGFFFVIFLVLCVVLYVCVLLVSVLCLVCPMLPFAPDCPFLIAPSVFSNV